LMRRAAAGAATTGGGIAETGAMFGGGWGRLAARGEGSGGGDGGVFGFISLFSILRITYNTYPGIFFASYVAGKATRTQGALRREGGPDCVLCRMQSFALREPVKPLYYRLPSTRTGRYIPVLGDDTEAK
jgi:hypothetical protein